LFVARGFALASDDLGLYITQAGPNRALDIVCSVLTQTSLSTQPRPVAGNVTLPAFAAVRRAAVRLLLTAEPTAANPPQRRAAGE